MKTDALFDWQPAQEEAFLKLKEQCCSQPVLKYFDVNKPVVLIQDGQPIANSWRSLTDVEGRYAQIAKEMLSMMRACKKFHPYIFGKEVTV